MLTGFIASAVLPSDDISHCSACNIYTSLPSRNQHYHLCLSRRSCYCKVLLFDSCVLAIKKKKKKSQILHFKLQSDELYSSHREEMGLKKKPVCTDERHLNQDYLSASC